MNINIPDSIKHMGPLLIEFFEGMTFKLHVNSHKDVLTKDSLAPLIDGMLKELVEFRDQLQEDRTDPNVLYELMDMSNFNFLMYAFLRSEGVPDARERYIKEYFDIDIETGRVYCKKRRAGSPLQIGEEVRGTVRNGVVYIRTQHMATGATVSMRRRDIIWFAAHGVWPSASPAFRIEYKEKTEPGSERTDDAISNLVAHFDYSDVPTYPFVSQYRPKGREGAANYGKWVYQRRHNFVMVRVGYYDTPQQAAEQGIKDWKNRVNAMKDNGNV